MLSLVGLHDSIGPWFQPRTMVYSGHNLVCIKRFNKLKFVQRLASINFGRIPSSIFVLNWA
jgi:hypothetical protein